MWQKINQTHIFIININSPIYSNSVFSFFSISVIYFLFMPLIFSFTFIHLLQIYINKKCFFLYMIWGTFEGLWSEMTIISLAIPIGLNLHYNSCEIILTNIKWFHCPWCRVKRTVDWLLIMWIREEIKKLNIICKTDSMNRDISDKYKYPRNRGKK